MATKNTIARKLYGCSFDELSGAQKAAVTRKFNEQSSEVSVAPRSNTVVAKIGRVGNNGVKESILNAGATVQDLLNQSGLSMDKQKETINARSTGQPVSLSDEVVANEMYIITPAIKSA